MAVIVLQGAALVIFVLGTLLMGSRLRRTPDRPTAEWTSRVMHGLFFACIVFPAAAGVVTPGLTHYDELLGVPPLPFRPVAVALGILLLVASVYPMVASNMALRRLGQGANAFRLTRGLVAAGIYSRTRNPMSLGYYLSLLGVTLVAGSTTLTAWVLLAIIPAHLFFLFYFEELELELRLGEGYREYKVRVPFLLPALRK